MKFKALGPGKETLLKAFGLSLAPIGIVQPLEGNQRKGEKSAGVGQVQGRNRFLEAVAPTTVEVDHGLYPGFVHFGEIPGHGGRG